MQSLITLAMKTEKISKGLKIVENDRYETGGYIVTGYLTQKDAKGKQKRVRKAFKGANALELAKAYKLQQETDDLRESFDNQRNYRETKLDSETEHIVVDLIRKLRETDNDTDSQGHTLLSKAVEFYISSPYRGTQDILLEELYDLYIQRDNFKNKSKKHKDAFCATIGFLKGSYGTRLISSITLPELTTFINRPSRTGGERSAASKRLEIAHVRALFEWARKQTLVKVSVAAGLERPELVSNEPVSLSIQQCQDILFFADAVDKKSIENKKFLKKNIDDTSLVGYTALALFAALRPFEVGRAEWEDIDWDEKVIRVKQRKGKTITRAVDLPDVCLDWLKHLNAQNRTGKIVPSNFTKSWAVVRAAAGFRIAEGSFKNSSTFGLDKIIKNCSDDKRPEWVNDVLRHTGITYRCKVIGHDGRVAQWAGNSAEEIENSYKSISGVTPKTTEQFYKLTPEKVLTTA